MTWQQHRFQLLLGLGVIALAALAALVTGLPMQSAYHHHALSACLPPSSRSGCELIVRHFESQYDGIVRVARYLVVLPALVGLFVGAPLLARELEHGTHRLAWTQTVTRRRWLLTKTLLLSLATALGAAILSAVVMWWRTPIDSLQGRIDPSGFEIEGLVVPAYSVFALTVGVFAGALLRRTIPAMSAALAAFLAARLVVAKFLRPHYMPALNERAIGLTPSAHSRDWVLQNSLVDAVGRTISVAREDLAIVHAQHAQIDPQEYLVALGWRRAVSFQPADRFWEFQGIEAALFLALAAVIVFATVKLVQRTPS
ncbi:MAG: hypothetical protein QOE36_2191 [Gaiellaceae bacterium]|nr:hypothetical protein [Gaiellaceae bacterium]